MSLVRILDDGSRLLCSKIGESYVFTLLFSQLSVNDAICLSTYMYVSVYRIDRNVDTLRSYDGEARVIPHKLSGDIPLVFTSSHATKSIGK